MLAVKSELMTSETMERGFGLAIANVMPGALALFGLAQHSELIRNWFGLGVSTSNTSVSGFLFVLAASAALGVLFGAFAHVIYEVVGPSLIPRMFSDFKPRSHNHAARQANGKETVYQNLLSQHYHYYQCYRNMSLCALFTGAMYLLTKPSGPAITLTIIAMVTTVSALYVAAKEAIHRYEDKRESLLKAV